MQNTFNSFNLLNKVDLDIDNVESSFGLNMDDLFVLGARVNPKRSFLFISKLLGKHLEVHPQIPKLSGYLLANAFTKEYEGHYFSDMNKLIPAIKKEEAIHEALSELEKKHQLHEDVLFLGFAETATGLGHAVFSAFDNAHYVHTTRDVFSNKESVFDFKEEHSHATDHLCYLNDKKIIEKTKHIVLIDDEITTGNTCLNLINSLNQLYPNKKYTIVSLLDWRTKEHKDTYARFMVEHGVEVKNISLLSGEVVLRNNHVFEGQPLRIPSTKQSYRGVRKIYIPLSKREQVERDPAHFEKLVFSTGRFGMSSADHEEMEREAKEKGIYLSALRRGKKTLCIGNGEFMYVPSRIASHMGEGVSFKSSTRSPIYVDSAPGYPIQDRMMYEVSNGVLNYLYNLNNEEFDEIFMFFEESFPQKAIESIAQQLQARKIQNVTFISV